jgi:hypothetical protein
MIQDKVFWVGHHVVLWYDTNVSENLAASVFRMKHLTMGKKGNHFTLKIEIARSSETLVTYCYGITTQEDST